jgi:hypothetical protein
MGVENIGHPRFGAAHCHHSLRPFNDNRDSKYPDLYEGFLLFIVMSMLCLYIIARIALLVLPFMALRALPPGAYVQLDWVSFLPHI